jgi:hypothetical protein
LDDGGSGDVDDEGCGFHEAYLVFADHASGLGGEGGGDDESPDLARFTGQVLGEVGDEDRDRAEGVD